MMINKGIKLFCRCAVFMIGLALFSIAPLCVYAAEINVPTQYPTLQAAIDASASNDTIIVQPGTYTENINFRGKAIKLTGTNPLDPAVVAATIIDGNMNGSVVTFNSGETPASVLTGFTIRNGNGTLNPNDNKRYGGGIYCAGQSNPTIRHNKIINNTADTGGGIYIHGNTAPTITAGPNASYPYAGVSQTVTLSTAATDPDGDTLIYTWAPREGGTITGAGSTVSFSSATAGLRHIDLTVDDRRGGTAKATVTVTVIGVTVQAIPQLFVDQTATLPAVLIPAIADSPEYPVSITWSVTQGPAAGTFESAVNGTSQATSIAFTPSASGPGTIRAEYKVGTASITDTVNFALNPTVTSIEPVSALQGDAVDVVIQGNNLGRVNGIDIGSGVTTAIEGAPTETTLHARFMVNVDAGPGPRAVVLSTPAGSHTVSPVFRINALPAVTANPINLNLTTGGTGSITFSIPDPAPPGGLSLILSSSATDVATVAALASIPAGGQSVAVTVNAIGGGTAAISANVTGYARAQTVVNVTNPALISFSPSPLNLAVGLVERCTVSISNPAPTDGLAVTLTENTGNLYVPTTVTIPKNQTSAIFNARGLAAGGTTITATAPNYPNTTLQATVVQGQLTLSPTSLPVAVGRSSTLTLSIPNSAPPGGLTVSITSSNAAFATVPATVTIPENTKSVSVQVNGVAAGSATVTAGAAGFASAQSTVNVQQYSVSFSPASLIITPGATRTADVVLSAPAPTGGLTITFTNPAPALVSTPSTVVVPEGQTGTAIDVAGLDTTTTPVVVSASAGGLSEGQLSVTVQQKIQPLIKADIVVGAGCRSQGTVGLQNTGAAPAGGYSINLTSSDPAVASVPQTVVIPQGSNYVTFTIVGKTPGSAVITASAAGYTSADTATVVKAGFEWQNIPPEITTGTSKNVQIRTNVANGSMYYSPNSKYGNINQYVDQEITVDLASGNPAVIQTPATVTILSGSSYSGYFAIQAVGIGTSTITASAPNMNEATTPTITVGNPSLRADYTVGSGCRSSGGVVLTGGTAPSGGYTVNLASSDPAIATVPATVTIPQGRWETSFPIAGGNPGTATVTMSAGGFTATGTVTVVKSALQFRYVPTQMTMGTSTSISLRNYVPNGSGYSGASIQNLDQPLTVTLSSSNLSVLQAPATVTIQAGNYDVYFTLQATEPGTGTITAIAANWDGATSDVVTVTGPSLRADVTVGAGCRTTGSVVFAGGSAPAGGYTVNLTSSDPTVATVPATVTIPQGSSYKDFTISGHSPGTAAITMTAGSFTATSTVTTVKAGFAWSSTPPSQMTLGAGTWLSFYTNVPNGSYYSGTYKSTNTRQAVDQPLTVAFASSDPSVIQTPAATTIGAGDYSQSATIQAVGLGSATVTLGSEGWDSLTSNAMAVVGPQMRADVTVGAGCRTTGSVALTGGSAPTGGYTVNLTSSDPTIATVPATATIPQGSSSTNFVVVGHSPGTATITMTVGGFTATNVVTVVAPQLRLTVPSGLNIGANGTISVNTYVPGGSYCTPTSCYGNTNQAVDQTLTVSLMSSNSSVIQVPATTAIAAGSGMNGSVSIQAVGPGSAAIAAEASGWTRTESSAIQTIDWLKADVTVGVGCRTTGTLGMATGSAPYGGYTVTLTSSDPSIVGIPATVTIPQYQSYTRFNIVGHSPGTATITLSSGTYTTSSTVTVVKPTFRWEDNPAEVTAGASSQMSLVTHVPDGTHYMDANNKYEYAYQTVDQPLTVTLSASDGSVIQPPATVTIPQDENSVYFDVLAVGLGSNTVTASSPGWDSATSETITTNVPWVDADSIMGTGCQVRGEMGFPDGFAPAGGTTFTLTSSDPTVATVPATVTIPEDGSWESFLIKGHNPGTATITLSVGGVSVTAVVTVVKPTFRWDYVPAHISVGTSKTVYIYTLIPGGGSNAVTDNLTVSISNTDPAAVQVPATVTIPAGSNSVSFQISAVGTGSSIITASAPGWDDKPTNTISTASGPWFAADVTVGGGCKTYGITGTGDVPAPVGGTTFTLTSSDPTVATIPATVTIPEGNSLSRFEIVGHNLGTATITMSSGETTATSATAVVKPALKWDSVPAQTYAGATPSLSLRVYAPNGTGYSSTGYRAESTSQAVDQPLTVNLASSSPSIVEPVSGTATTTSGYVSFQVRALAVGTATITASAPGWDSITSEPIAVVEGGSPGDS